jgi:hypothetical protein
MKRIRFLPCVLLALASCARSTQQGRPQVGVTLLN